MDPRAHDPFADEVPSSDRPRLDCEAIIVQDPDDSWPELGSVLKSVLTDEFGGVEPTLARKSPTIAFRHIKGEGTKWCLLLRNTCCVCGDFSFALDGIVRAVEGAGMDDRPVCFGCKSDVLVERARAIGSRFAESRASVTSGAMLVTREFAVACRAWFDEHWKRSGNAPWGDGLDVAVSAYVMANRLSVLHVVQSAVVDPQRGSVPKDERDVLWGFESAHNVKDWSSGFDERPRSDDTDCEWRWIEDNTSWSRGEMS